MCEKVCLPLTTCLKWWVLITELFPHFNQSISNPFLCFSNATKGKWQQNKAIIHPKSSDFTLITLMASGWATSDYPTSVTGRWGRAGDSNPYLIHLRYCCCMQLFGKLKTVLKFSTGRAKGDDFQWNSRSSGKSQTTHLDFPPLRANTFQIHLRGLVFRHF